MEKHTIGIDSAFRKPSIGKILPSLLGGVAGALVIAAASISLAMLITHSYLFGSPTMVEQWQQLLLQNERVWFAEVISAVLLLAGVAILVGSYLLYRKPEQSEKWGYLILMGAVTSLFWIGGFLIGPILGILVGAIAIYRSKKEAAKPET
jgi:hypothetical protein